VPEEVASSPEYLPNVVVVRPPKRRLWLHALLFLLTCFTCMVVGARMQQNFDVGQPAFFSDDFFPLRQMLAHPRELLKGIPFAASLLAILFAHEMGHFLLAVKNQVYATLPFFLPAPTPIGTFGAFIQIRSRFHSRSELLDIAVGGPIAGFVVAVPLAVIGLLLSPTTYPATPSDIGFPLIFHLSSLVLGRTPVAALHLHPVAIAAWVGMLATALNLLPGGQLDGGHIMYALSPRAHKRLTLFFAIALLLAAVFYWSGWLIWAIAFHVTRKHPPVLHAERALPRSRRLLAWTALVIFLLTAMPAPFAGGGFLDSIGIKIHLHQ
jgi:membrane-associated protease RseP (regulator of RpoE activity)